MFIQPFHRLQTLHDLNAARTLLSERGASAKTCAPLDMIATALHAQTSPTAPVDWATLTKPLGAAPAGVFAALAQGLFRLAERELIPEQTTIPNDAHLTRSKAQVEDALTHLARGHLSVDLCKIVSKADYGLLADEHEAALLHMRDVDFANIPLKDRWVPMEVLELVSHVTGDDGHLPCLAIVMLDAVRTGDDYGSASFRWETQFSHLLGLPAHLRDPLCAAFRFLYENGNAEDLFFRDSEHKIPKDAFFPFLPD